MKQLDLIENVSTFERGSRLVLSAALIGAVLAAPDTSPAVLALVALYPAFTALLAWDPVYQMISKFATSGGRTTIGAPARISTRTPQAANRAR